MRFNAIAAVAAASLTLALSSAATAHATLAQDQAVTGSYYVATMNVPHGCEGSPTLKVRIKIPDGVTGVKPQPKAGWQLETVTGKLDKPYTDHGKTITEGVTEVVWTGKLLDSHFDQFAMQVKLPGAAPGSMIFFPTVQECEKGAHRWIEIPAAGKTRSDYKEPAPFLRIIAKP
jgi:uncharacterized protein YcnI